MAQAKEPADDSTTLRLVNDAKDDGNPIAEPPALYLVSAHDGDLNDKSALSSKDAPVRSVATLEVEAAAGGGAYNLDEAPAKGEVWFRYDWLERKGLYSNQCVVISVHGDSMYPTLPQGAKILVARHRLRRRSGHIFVINTQDGLIVKRLGKDDKGRWQLASDNPAPDWPTRPWPRDAEVIGEVMWVGVNL